MSQKDFFFWTNLWPIPLHLLFFLFLDKPLAYTCRTYFSNIFCTPNIKKYGFLILNQYCHYRPDNYIIILFMQTRGFKSGLFYHPPKNCISQGILSLGRISLPMPSRLPRHFQTRTNESEFSIFSFLLTMMIMFYIFG